MRTLGPQRRSTSRCTLGPLTRRFPWGDDETGIQPLPSCAHENQGRCPQAGMQCAAGAGESASICVNLRMKPLKRIQAQTARQWTRINRNPAPTGVAASWAAAPKGTGGLGGPPVPGLKHYARSQALARVAAGLAFNASLAMLTITPNAAASVAAMSARTLRSSATLAALRPSMKRL